MGPGTHLKQSLKRFGTTEKPDCPCNERCCRMDTEGSDWCEKNIELIIDWLEEEAERRGLPFARLAGKILIRRAIHNSRKEQTHEMGLWGNYGSE